MNIEFMNIENIENIGYEFTGSYLRKCDAYQVTCSFSMYHSDQIASYQDDNYLVSIIQLQKLWLHIREQSKI